MASFVRSKIRGREPFPRSRHATVLHRDRVYLFGGVDEHGRLTNNDFFVLNCSDRLWSELPVTGSKPSKRSGHSWTLVQDKAFLFGGHGDEGHLNDVQIFHLDKKSIAKPKPKGTAPAARYGHSATAVKEEIVVFGGSDADKSFNDLHVLDTKIFAWREVSASGEPPAARRFHSAVLVGSRLFVIGGTDGQTQFGDVHVLDTATFHWSRVAVIDPIEPLCSSAAFLFDKLIFVCCGRSVDGVTDRVYAFDIESGRFRRAFHSVDDEQLARDGHTINGPHGADLYFLVGGSGNTRIVNGFTLHAKNLTFDEPAPHSMSEKTANESKPAAPAPAPANAAAASTEATKPQPTAAAAVAVEPVNAPPVACSPPSTVAAASEPAAKSTAPATPAAAPQATVEPPPTVDDAAAVPKPTVEPVTVEPAAVEPAAVQPAAPAADSQQNEALSKEVAQLKAEIERMNIQQREELVKRDAQYNKRVEELTTQLNKLQLQQLQNISTIEALNKSNIQLSKQNSDLHQQLTDTQQQAAEAAAAAATVTGTSEDKTQQIQQLHQALQAETDTRQRVESRAQELEVLNIQLRSKCEAMDQMCLNLSQEIASLHQQLDKSTSTAPQPSEFDSVRLQLENDLQEKTELIAKLEHDIEQWMALSEQLQSAGDQTINDLQAENERLKAELSQWQTQYEEQMQKRQKLEQEMESSESQLKDVYKRLSRVMK